MTDFAVASSNEPLSADVGESDPAESLSSPHATSPKATVPKTTTDRANRFLRCIDMHLLLGDGPEASGPFSVPYR